MIRLLTQCNGFYGTLRCCHNDPERQCNCYICLREDLYGGQDTYSCLKKLCYYTMNYGPAYVSEIYHFLNHTQILNNFIGGNVNILSLGCGFAPDYIAIMKCNLPITVDYLGIDVEPLWDTIRNGILPNHCFRVHDVLQGVNVSGYDIVIMNKLFSTLKNHNMESRFLDILESEIQNHLNVGSYLIFNDVNHYGLGRDIFHNRIRRILPQHNCYFFDVENAYNNNYEEIANIGNVCQIPPHIHVSPKQTVTKSVIFLVS